MENMNSVSKALSISLYVHPADSFPSSGWIEKAEVEPRPCQKWLLG